MNSLKKQWISQTEPEADSSWGMFLNEYQKREDKATRFCDGLRTVELQQGITSCINRGNRCLSIKIPAYVIGTKAYGDFHQWALDQGLALMLGTIDEPSDSAMETFVITFAPFGER